MKTEKQRQRDAAMIALKTYHGAVHHYPLRPTDSIQQADTAVELLSALQLLCEEHGHDWSWLVRRGKFRASEIQRKEPDDLKDEKEAP